MYWHLTEQGLKGGAVNARKEGSGPKTPKKQSKSTPKRIARRSSSSKELPDIEENRLAADQSGSGPNLPPNQGDVTLP